MTTEASRRSRVPWRAVPSHVKDAVADLLDSPVVHAESQEGGFSPGSADRVVCADGRRAFVKTATADANPDVIALHRQEAAVAAVLPASVPAPGFIGAADGGDWIALVFEEVDGRHPDVAGRERDLDAILDALAATTAAVLDDRARQVIPLAGPAVADLAGSWGNILADPRHPVDASDPDVAWALAQAERWDADALLVEADAAGDALLHFDVRADNVLVRPDGTAVLVDWPWAQRGAPWFDALLLLVDARFGAPALDVESALRHPVFATMDAAAATRAIAAVTGYMLDRGRLPDPQGLPTLRAFQRAQGVVASRLLRERLG